MSAQQAMTPETAAPRWRQADSPRFDSRIVCYVGVLLLAGDAWTLGQLWSHGDALFGRSNAAGHDLAVFWAAGRLAAMGNAAAAYDWSAIHDLIALSIGTSSIKYATIFSYPPWFLLVLAPLGSLPYAMAAGLWLTGLLAFYLATIRKIVPGGTALIAALAAPAVFANIVLGQDGLLTASLFAAAALLLDAVPVVAGIVIGLLAYKPQFGLLLPLFLMATGRWRVFAGAAATVGALAAAAALRFGPGVFEAFARALPTTASAHFQHSGLLVGDWGQLAGVYGLLRWLGLASPAAWCGHIGVASAAALGLLWVVGRGPRAELQAASLATASVVASPYSHIWDLTILTVAVAFLVRDGLAKGFAKAEWAAMAAVFLLPLAPTVALGIGPDAVDCVIGPLMCAILALLIGRRIIGDPTAQAHRNFPETVPLGDD